MIGVISGSMGLALDEAQEIRSAKTPFGEASAPPRVHVVSGRPLVVLPRHGDDHQFAPHEINYQANVKALHDAGVDEIVALFTVGGIDPVLEPGNLVVPDQLIDYTWGRAHTFSGSSNGEAVNHVLFDEPYDAALRRRLLAADKEAIDGGVYACTQGPRLETEAEIRRLSRDGCTIVGMTGMPEASLARELGIPYAAVCLVVNPAAGVGAIVMEDMARVARAGEARLGTLIRKLH